MPYNDKALLDRPMFEIGFGLKEHECAKTQGPRAKYIPTDKKERKRVLKPVSLLLLERHASYLKTAILPIPIQEGEGEEGEGGCGGGEGRGEERD